MNIRVFVCVFCLCALTKTTSAFPALTYSTYLRDAFTPHAMATDSAGNIYLAGDAIVDPGNLQTTALIIKLNPQATAYLYVRYLGGSSYDSARSIAVDSAGNAYVVGATSSPDFLVTPGGNLGTPPSSRADGRSFVAKFDPNGDLLFSYLLGGSSFADAQAVAVTPAGQVVVSGISYSANFPSSAGAYSVPNTGNRPYLLEVDPTGTKLVFSATGIGGTSLAVDAAGNIYMAGSTGQLDYPTTPGAYQTAFPKFYDCGSPSCFTPAQGPNQYVTKVDPTGKTLVFSTSVSGSFNTTNNGMAIDSDGHVYLTGFAGGNYPYTVAAPVPGQGPPFSIPALPFLSKLDASGQKLLFSVPVGGAGVQVDSHGSVYVGGIIGTPQPGTNYYVIPNSLPALANVPAQCLPNAQIQDSVYASRVDAASGEILGTQFIGGSTINVTASTFSGTTLWIAGPTMLLDFPFAPQNEITILPPFFHSGTLPGAYLGAVDFAQPEPPAGTPQIACIVDSADYTLAGSPALNQLLTIFGSGLGPEKGVTAADYTMTQLAGVTVGVPDVPLLYVSSSQINFAIPPGRRQPPGFMEYEIGTPLTVTVNGLSSALYILSPRPAAPSLFLAAPPPPASNSTAFPLPTLALNADGSTNSSTNPARGGSIISVFVNGLSAGLEVTGATMPLFASNNWTITDPSNANPYVLKLDLQVPTTLVGDFGCSLDLSLCTSSFQIFEGTFAPASLGGTVYVTGVKTQ